ncbi:maleylpyruvate isomerase family mycothiol-dependent enzyme [Streptomyces cinnabarinus]|uniref:Maleylpyruvate isomerase family mycothiol-dependent enzyme n=1 Tax=Streptomyces cinnabarinus TaxID=67287 RepID=A0ABY7KEJ0_9ACTN|nr:maleylpyruvate isomerase family mycothiol-dependent enzyme [Streptomyces cinnabarinus]WAZ22493.1 maleylpyruvate isomerase family mycothiol-dependent enzyme [Streptomyces cinnabarinus]
MTDTWVRDPEAAGRLLAVERDALVPMVRGRAEADFAVAVEACPGWSVRDVLAHCSAALSRVLEGRFEKGVFSPAANDRDIADRASWPTGRIVDELERGMTEAGPVLAKAGGALDVLALGEWVHGGDVREAWGEPEPYAGPGLPYALPLLASVTRARGHLALHADLDDIDDPLRLGADAGDRTPARFIGDAATLVRLYSGRRPVAGVSYELAGAEEGELNIFG